MSNRIKLRALALGLAVLAALGCGSSAGTAQEAPRRGGTLVYGINSGDRRPTTATSRRCSRSSTCCRRTTRICCRIDLTNYPKVVGDLAESWTVAPRRQGLHLQPAPRRQVPRRLAVLRGGCEGELRSHPQPAAGRRLGAPGPRRRHRHHRNAGSTHRHVSPEAAQPRPAVRLRQSLQLHLQRRQAQGEPDLPRPQRAGHRSLPLRRACCGLALEGRALQGLLQARTCPTSMASTPSSRRAPPSSTRCRAGRSWPSSAA